MIRLLIPALPEGEILELAPGEVRYLARVRRALPGERVELRDPDGRRAEAEVDRAGRDGAAVRILRRLPDAPAPLPIHLLVAAPKRTLLDGVVRAASELGAARLTPVLTGRSVMRPGDGRVERWRRIAEEAVRQCGRGAPLVVDRPAPLEEAVGSADPRSTRAILLPDAGAEPLARVLARHGTGAVTLAVGPEGGFDGPEVELARARGFEPATFGEGILRVETAAVAAVAVAAALLGAGRTA